MPCYKPLMALVSQSRNGSKKKVTFPTTLPRADVAKYGTPTPLPCGQCIGCRLERSRQWAVRLMKEHRLHERSSFLTLTYDEESLPRTDNGLPTLVLRDVQLFMKRLRKFCAPHPIRFFLCGEYGENTHRPHYHLILFGEDFVKDRERIEDTPTGYPQYTSSSLSELWSMGRCTIGDVSFESAAYVARYVLKKVTGKGSEFHYQGRKPEFVTMSRRPGIGAGYFEEFKDEIYRFDEIVPSIGRPPVLPPKYFDRCLEKTDPALYEKIKKNRSEGLDFYSDPDSTDTRLKVRERVKSSIIKNCLNRSIK